MTGHVGKSGGLLHIFYISSLMTENKDDFLISLVCARVRVCARARARMRWSGFYVTVQTGLGVLHVKACVCVCCW